MSEISPQSTSPAVRRPARHLVAGLAVALLLLAASLSPAHATSSHMTIQLRPSSGPHTIRLGKTVTLHLTVSGIQLNAQHIGKRARDHQGHIQLYLDRIPRSAYARPSLQHWLASVAATTVSLRLTRGIVRTTGRHRIIAALARNNNVLYGVPAATFTLRIR